MGVVESVKDVLKVGGNFNYVELYKKLSELQARIMEFDEANHALQNEVHELRERARTAGELGFRDNSYWRTSGNGQQDGPFCEAFWHVEGKLVRKRVGAMRGTHLCRCCVTVRHR